MEVLVNGESVELDPPFSIARLIERYELEPLRVAVEVNQDLVRRADYRDRVLCDGDAVEIVTLVGGG